MDENTNGKPVDQPQAATTNVEVAPAPVESVEVAINEDGSIVPTVEAAGDPAGPEQPKTPSEEPKSTSETAKGTDAKDVPKLKLPEIEQHVAPPPMEHKKSGPIFAIVAAILVALGLAAVTVYAYLQTQEDEKKPTSSQTTNNQTEEADTSADDLEQAEQEADDALKASDETDFPESELTDQNLNL